MTQQPSAPLFRSSNTGLGFAPRWLGAVSVAALLAAGVTTSANAQNLQTLYETAKAYDATYLSARKQFEASQAKAQQAQAGLLPSAGLSADAFWNDRDSQPGTQTTFNNQTVKLAASQPLYRPANRLAHEQAQKSLLMAEAQLQTAEQELIVRSAQTYFDVLAASDNLTFVKAQKTAVSEQLAAAKRNFEVGTSTITDTREAEARFDLVTAQEIAAENDLRVKKLALDQLVGQSGTTPWGLAKPAVLPATEPGDVNAWVARSESEHPAIRQAMAGLEIAQMETRKAETGHLPTLDAVAQYQLARAPSSNPQQIPGYVRSNTASVGVQFNLPLFAGFAVQNRVKETLSLEEKARADLDAAKRNIAQATRAAFFGVVSGQGQVKALEAAETSSQSALDANKLGYQVGVRINIDVLNAQSQLFQTKASLAKARYDVLVGGLRLKQASGVLQAEDVRVVNGLLQAEAR
jgi:outer membrane protein